MQDLTLVGVHDDGEHLLFAGADGQRFRVRVDEALRAAVRRDRALLGQLQIEMDGRLRPRDIQARIRAGHSAEEVAAAAGLPLAHVRRYEGPVLAEREYVAAQARRVAAHRGTPGGPGAPTVGATVAERLARRELDPESAAWDAWREDDGSWTVQVSFLDGTRQGRARWCYDPQVRHVIPLDDEARWLTDADVPEPGPIPQRRLAAVTAPQAAEPLHEPAPDPAAEPAPDAVASTVDLLDTLRERRGRRSRALRPDEEATAPPDAVEDALGSLLSRAEVLGEAAQEHDPGPNHPARRRPRAADPEVVQLPDDSPLPVPVGGGVEPPAKEPAEDGERHRAARKSRRASVPSWDDIVFGARRE